MLEEPRSCSVCGGVVDVMTITKPLPNGRLVPTKIGACRRCAKWFNEAGLSELLPLAPEPPSAGPRS